MDIEYKHEEVANYMDYCLRVGLLIGALEKGGKIDWEKVFKDEVEIGRSVQDAERIPEQLRNGSLLRGFLRRLKALIMPEKMKKAREALETLKML